MLVLQASLDVRCISLPSLLLLLLYNRRLLSMYMSPRS